jgi:hypothetical protein
MTDSDLTVKILREIRDAILSTHEQTNARIDQTNAHLDQTNARLDKGFGGVVAILKHHDGRLVAIEKKLGGLKDIKLEVIFLGRYLKNRTEKELRDLRTRVAKLERKVG